jgi:Flp pilus assembly protein TadD
MVLCPACGAENPDGTKICVKCATELPKSAIPGSVEAKKQVIPGISGSAFSLWQHAKAMPQDMMDALWLVVIVLLVLIGFLGEATDWKFRFTDVEDAKVEEVQLPPAVEQAMPAPVKKIVHRPMPPPAPKLKAVTPKPTPPPPPPAPPIEEVKAPVVVKPTQAPIVAAAKPTPKPAEKPVQAPLAVAVAPAPVVKPPAVKPTPRPVLGEKPPAGLTNSQSLYTQSKSKFDAQQYETSFKLLKQALQVDPTYAKAYFGLGYIYNLFSMEDASVRMYEMSLRFDPQHASSMNNLGMIYYRAKNYEDAIYLLQKAVSSDPKNGDYPYNLANTLVEAGRTAEALAYFEKAVQLKPKEAVYYNDLALAYEKLGKAAQAEQAWNKVSELTSDPKLFDQAQTHLEFIKQQAPPAG